MILLAFWTELLRLILVMAILFVPVILLALFLLVRRHTRQVEKTDAEAIRQNLLKLDLIRQQGEALNWLTGDAKKELSDARQAAAEAKIEAAEARAEVTKRHIETQQVMTDRADRLEERADKLETKLDTKMANGGGES